MSRSKRIRRPEDVISTYTLDWSVLSTDSFGARASTEAKEVGPDLCKAFVMPAGRQVYEGVGAVSACTELLGNLTMVTFLFLLVFFSSLSY